MNLRLNEFCCCFTTRTGSLVIATLGWILTLLKILAAVVPTEQDKHNDSEYLYFEIGYGLVSLLVCVLLVVGVYKKDKRYILPWLCLKAFDSALSAILAVFLFFVVVLNFRLFVIMAIITALNVYFWLCVWSHYKELGEGPTFNGPTFNGPTLNVTYSAPTGDPPRYMEKKEVEDMV